MVTVIVTGLEAVLVEVLLAPLPAGVAPHLPPDRGPIPTQQPGDLSHVAPARPVRLDPDSFVVRQPRTRHQDHPRKDLGATTGSTRRGRSCASSVSGPAGNSTPSPAGSLRPWQRTDLLNGSGELVLVDVDDSIIEVHGHAKQGASFGYTRVLGLNMLLATASTRSAVVVRSRAAPARGLVRLAASREATGRRRAESVRSLRPDGAAGPVRADSTFYGSRPDPDPHSAKAGLDSRLH